MTTEQTIVIALGAFFVGLAALVTFLFHRSLLSLRYWVGWMFTAACMALGSVLALVSGTKSDWYWTVPLVVAAPVLLLISVQLSVSISGHRRLIIRLAQEVAELASRLDAVTLNDATPPNDRSTEHVQEP